MSRIGETPQCRVQREATLPKARWWALCALLLCLFGCDPTGPRTGPGLEPPGTVLLPGANSASEGTGDTTGKSSATGGMGSAAGAGAGTIAAVADAGLPQNSGVGGMAGGNAGFSSGGNSSAPPVNPPCDGLHVAVVQDPLGPLPEGRAPTLSCRYTMPADATVYLPERVGFQYTTNGAVTPVLHVRDASACDPMNGGWYYDLLSNAGRIVVCPQSCRGEGGELVLGCPVTTHP